MLKCVVSKQPQFNAVYHCFCRSNTFNKHSVIAFRQIASFSIGRPIKVFHKDMNSMTSALPALLGRTNSTSSAQQPVPEEQKLSNKDKLKRAVKDYGVTVILFHISLSLTTLSISYLAVSSGVDVASLLSKLGVSSSSDLATGASTFVVAYAFHKMFAPVRISITLGAAPFIVRYLRRVGILKPPKTSGQ